MQGISEVWVFNGFNSRFPSAIFISKEKAHTWIVENKLSGVLTLYSTNEGVYDWAIRNNYFVPKNESECTSEFIQKFYCLGSCPHEPA